MDFVVDKLLRGVLAPAGAGALVALAAGLGRPALARSAGAGALGPAPGFLLAFALIKGAPQLVPGSVIGWLPHAALAGLGLGLLEGACPTRPRLRWAARALLLLLLILATLRPKLAQWEPGSGVLVVAGVLALGLASWLGQELLRSALSSGDPVQPTDRPTDQHHGPATAGAGAACAQLAPLGATAAVLALGGSAILGQLGGALASAGAPLFFLLLLRPGLPLMRGAAPALTLTGLGLVLNAAFYTGDLARAVPPLLVLAPWGGLLVRLPALRARPAWQRAAVATAGALLLVIAAGVVAFLTQPPEDPYAGY